MQGDEVIKDALEKVSDRLRKAVGLNRHQLGGFRNTVSQMNRERNRSVGIMSKQQQDFIQKQAKLLPTLTMNKMKRARKTSNKVIPLDVRNSVIDEHQPVSRAPSKGLSKNQYNVLPPIRKISRSSRDQAVQGLEDKEQRMSDYKKEFSSLQESLNNAYKFANSHGVLDSPTRKTVPQQIGDSRQNTKLTQSRKLDSFDETEENNTDRSMSRKLLSQSSRQSSKGLQNPIKYYDVNSSTEIDTHATTERSKVREKTDNIDPVDLVAIENASAYETRSNAASRWNTVRNRLRYISMMNQTKHDRYLDKLYEEIRNCRYIRKPRRKDASPDSTDEDVFN